MKKSNQSDIPTSIDEYSLEDNPGIQWIIKNGRYLLWAVLAFVALALLIYRFSASETVKAEKDYIDADRAFQTLQEVNITDVASKEALQKLAAIMLRQPELHAKYDGPIAQTLINRGDIDSATEYANLAIARTKSEESPYYTDYSQTTLLIGKKSYSEALKQAIALQAHLDKADKSDKGVVLMTYNLWRIALLQKELGLKSEELKTWQQWKLFYSENRGPVLEAIVAAFTEGKVTMLEFIETREAALK
jgi:hypothetical protein